MYTGEFLPVCLEEPAEIRCCHHGARIKRDGDGGVGRYDSSDMLQVGFHAVFAFNALRVQVLHAFGNHFGRPCAIRRQCKTRVCGEDARTTTRVASGHSIAQQRLGSVQHHEDVALEGVFARQNGKNKWSHDGDWVKHDPSRVGKKRDELLKLARVDLDRAFFTSDVDRLDVLADIARFLQQGYRVFKVIDA